MPVFRRKFELKTAGKPPFTKQKCRSCKSKPPSKEIHCFPIFQKLQKKTQRHRKARESCHLAGRRTTRRVPKQRRPRPLPLLQMAVVGRFACIEIILHILSCAFGFIVMSLEELACLIVGIVFACFSQIRYWAINSTNDSLLWTEVCQTFS